ncbi:MFS transporter [Nannocystaceae bacterium ST9]
MRGASDEPLLRNRGFRRLWLGDAVSLLGDWFTYVALGTLVVAADQGLIGVAFVLLGHSLPRVLCGPWAGRLADRIDRRTILIAFSLLRALTVLAMMAAAQAQALALVQALLFVRMAFGAFIDPAATAMLPQLVAGDRIARANALIGATWSVMFALGVAIGGIVTASIGPLAALAVDASTFVIAALVFASLPRSPPRPKDRDPRDPAPTREGGWAIAWRRPELLAAALAKIPAALANGGAWVLLHARAGEEPFGATALSLGILHAARAIGTGIGPLAWVGPLRGSEWGLRLGNLVALIGVAGFALVDDPALMLAAVLVWGLGMGANWVTATTRMQVASANDQLGRVASVDLVAHSLSQCVGGLFGAWLADRWLDPTLSAWWGALAGLLGWLAVGVLVRTSAREHGLPSR